MAANVPARKRPRSAFLTLATALVLSLLAAPAAVASPASAPVPRLAWADCGDGFECATARVPLDYDRPHGAKISLALIRLPAGGPGRKIGSIFLNPGGPGGSGVDYVRGVGQALFSPEVRARFDLIGFDPRGISRSTPLRCFETLEDGFATLAPFPFPVTKAEERIWTRSDVAFSRECAERAGPIIDHMSTANVARDLDLLRQAVGDKKLTYHGISYGTYIGASYANLFPKNVRALVVDAVLDPVAWANNAAKIPFSTRLKSNQGAYETLQQFLALCDQGGPNCAFSDGNPKRRYDRLAKRLLAAPAQLPDGEGGTFPFTYQDLVSLTLGAMYDPFSWPFLAELLQELDTFTSPARAAEVAHELRVRLGAYQQEEYENFLEGGIGVYCTDSRNPDRFSAWSKAARAADREFPYFGRPWTWLSSVCKPWPGEDHDRYGGPFTRKTANDVLVVGNRYDPATRYQGAVKLDRLLPRSRLLTLDGWGHSSLFLSACIDSHVNRYLLTGQVPPRGTVCQPDFVPFAEPLAAALTASSGADRTAVIPPMIRKILRD